MRLILVFALAAFAGVAVNADEKVEKIDAEKLIGKWQIKEKPGAEVEFGKDGKMRITADGVKLEPDAHERSYKVDNNKIVATTADGKKDMTYTAIKIADNEIVITNRGQVETLIRVQEKP
ncbi:hypothetical protein R5W23_003603 [Gemmata sp. JC673]|uniref:Lipocalin-like domain-containing protein n=1 Tax=Gemmata algarum TaxID=2975278 RepID=A0ABU5F432_9BACT|nr:hypothetical protein [Gemmata algarum]MDY3562156.1 hypothetical protein [Gemmata algarum]